MSEDDEQEFESVGLYPIERLDELIAKAMKYFCANIDEVDIKKFYS